MQTLGNSTVTGDSQALPPYDGSHFATTITSLCLKRSHLSLNCFGRFASLVRCTASASTRISKAIEGKIELTISSYSQVRP
ncbi:MAG TPA: hypothetical protein V6C90_27830 [Coleofasciculaceae cyanobacterium]